MGLTAAKAQTTVDTSTAPAFRVLPSPIAAPAAPAPAKRPGLNLGGLVAGPAKKTGGKNYPLASLTFEQQNLVDQLLGEKAQAKALEGSIDTLTAELLAVTVPQYFAAVSGHGDALTSLVATGTASEAIIVHTSRYKTGIQRDAVAAVIGETRTEEFFTEATTLQIDFEKIPEAIRQSIIDAVVGAASEHGCTGAITAKQFVTPRAHFHGLRHARLSVDENVALQSVCPMVCQVKARA